MPLFGLLKLFFTSDLSKSAGKSLAIIALIAVSGDRIIKYVDHKQAEGLQEFRYGRDQIQKTMDERHQVIITALENIRATVVVTEQRVWEISRKQRQESATVGPNPKFSVVKYDSRFSN